MSFQEQELKGRVALITGASSGIGRALSLALAAEGMNLVLAARSLDKLNQLSGQAARLSQAEVLVQPMDVSQQDQVQELARAVENTFGQVHLLVNNAGVCYGGTVADSDPEQMQRMIQVNLWGPYLVTHYCLPLMQEGDVVNISSVAGLRYAPGFAIYSATKFGLKALGEGLRNEVQSQGIRVLTVYPGVTDTDFFSTFTPDGKPPANVVKGEPLTAEQVARAIVAAIKNPPGVAVNELVIRPIWQRP